MTPDLDKYRKNIADLPLTREEQDALLRALWAIMESFADSAFMMHPAQVACGKLEEICRNAAATAPNEVECDNSLLDEYFQDAVANDESEAAERVES